jgi:hypothetical protein
MQSIRRFLKLLITTVLIIYKPNCSQLERIGTPYNSSYKTGTTIYDKVLHCFDIVVDDPFLIKSKNLFGNLYLPENYSDICDYVTVFAKLSKIRSLVDNVTSLHPQNFEVVLSELDQIIGNATDTKNDQTIYGHVNAIAAAFSTTRSDDAISTLIGSANSEIGTKTLLEILNSAIYELSVKPIIQNTLVTFAKQIDLVLEIIQHELANNNKEYFLRIIDYIKYSSLFLSENDITSIEKSIGLQTDNEATLYGIINQIKQVCDDKPVDIDEQLMQILALSVTPNKNSLTGCLNTIYWPIRTKLINMLKNNKLRQAINPFFEGNVSDFKLFNELIAKIDDVVLDFDDEHFGLTFDCKTTIPAIVCVSKMAYDIFAFSQNFDPSFQSLIGERYSLLHQNTLSSFVYELLDGFYISHIRNTISTSISAESNLVWEKILNYSKENKLEGTALKAAPYFGNRTLVDFEHPNTLCKRIALLKDALCQYFANTNHNTAIYINSIIGTHATQRNTLYGYLHSMQSKIDSSDINACKQLIVTTKSLIDDALFSMHKSVFLHYFKTVNSKLHSITHISPTLTQQCGLEIAIQNINLEDIISFFEDDSYTLRKQTIIDMYNLLGMLSGHRLQVSLAGNVLSITDDLITNLNIMKQNIGNVSDFRISSSTNAFNTLYGNINWIKHQLSNNKICSCVKTGVALHMLSNEISLFGETLQYFGKNLDCVIEQYPKQDFTERAVVYIRNALNIMDSNILQIYLTKKELEPTADAISGSDSTTPCQTYKLNDCITQLHNSFHSLTVQMQALLCDEILYVPLDTNETDVSILETSLHNVNSNLQKLVNIFDVFVGHLLDVKFLPLTSDAFQMIGSYQNIIGNIQKNIENIATIDPCTTLSHHISKDRNATLFKQMSCYATDIITKLSRLDDLVLLCNSQTSFQLANIARLINELSNVLKLVFVHDDLDVDSFIRNRQIDQYIKVLLKIVTKICVNVSEKQSTNEIVLGNVTDALFLSIRTIIKFAKNVLYADVNIPQKYLIQEDTQYREIPLMQITTSVHALAKVLNTDILNIVQQSRSLSFNEVMVSSLRAFAEQLAIIQHNVQESSFYQLAVQIGQNKQFDQSLINLHTAFSCLICEFNKPRCCQQLTLTLSHIKYATKTATQLFSLLIDTIFKTDHSTQDLSVLQEQFAPMGRCLCEIASAINLCSKKIMTITRKPTIELCITNKIQPEVNAILLAIQDLRDVFANSLQQQIVQDVDISEQEFHNADELHEIAEQIYLWHTKLQFVVTLAMEYLNVDVSEHTKAMISYNFADYFAQNKNLLSFFIICDSAPYLAPFFTNISKSLYKLSSILGLLLHSGKSLCNFFHSSQLIPNVTLIAQNITKIVRSIQMLIDMFEPIKSKNVALTIERIIDNGASFWLLGTNTDKNTEIFYRHKLEPSLFIKKIVQLQTSDGLCPAMFMFDGEQVIFDEFSLVIDFPTRLCGKKISDFAPINVLSFLPRCIQEIQGIHRAINLFCNAPSTIFSKTM